VAVVAVRKVHLRVLAELAAEVLADQVETELLELQTLAVVAVVSILSVAQVPVQAVQAS